jgi:non-specific serine/threonine protein kinase
MTLAEQLMPPSARREGRQLATVSATTGYGNLPAKLSSFVGRKRELEDIRLLLRSARILTLTGPGGVGKTRLALASAEEVSLDFDDGVWLVELAPLVEAQYLAAAVGRVLGHRGQSGMSLIQSLANALRDRRLLLVLDNCEHLIAACADFATMLLRACPGITVFATSREPLGVEGEQVFAVPPIGLPDLNGSLSVERLRAIESVHLFVERARASRSDFQLTSGNAAPIAELCHRLDGLPLAIELAAAEVRGLEPQQILNRIDQRLRCMLSASRIVPARQQSLQATIDWSYALLSETEKSLLARLGIFAGGWTIEAAESVAAEVGLEKQHVLPALLRLVDKSLVVAERSEMTEVRYRLLEVLRQDALERLIARGESSRVRDAHAAFFLGLAEQLEPAFGTKDEASAFAQLESEYANIRASLTWLVERGDAVRAMQFAGALWRFWLHRVPLQEGWAHVEDLLTFPGHQPPALRLKLLNAAARFAVARNGELALAEDYASAGLSLAVEIGDHASASSLRCLLGDVARLRGDYELAQQLHAEGVRMARSAVTTQVYPAQMTGVFEYQNLWRIGLGACYQGEFACARAYAEDALSGAAAAGLPRLVAQALRTLGHTLYREGDYGKAYSLVQESIRVWATVEDRLLCNSADSVMLLACITRDRGDYVTAQNLLAETDQALEKHGDRRGRAQILDISAGLAAACTDSQRAFELAGAAEAEYASMGIDATHAYRFELERWLQSAAQGLMPADRARAVERGRGLTRIQAVAEALSIDPRPARVSGRREPRSELTPREVQVARLIASGATDHEIATVLVISDNTAHAHVRNILSKLGVKSRVQVAAWAASSEIVNQSS